MKKLNKLKINTEKVIKNDELVNLKGGYEGYQRVSCFSSGGYLGYVNTSYCPSQSTQLSMCRSYYPSTQYTICNF
jgi:hypothetical protein